MVVGTDIAELLMKGRKGDTNLRPPSVASNSSGVVEASDISGMGPDSINCNSNSSLKEEYVTNKFREYLLYGSGKEALGMFIRKNHILNFHQLFLKNGQ